MKKTTNKKEFTDTNFTCPFKKRKCSRELCTHFKTSQWKSYWGGRINLMDSGSCYAGGTRVELWESDQTIEHSHYTIPFWDSYRELRKTHSPIASLLLADTRGTKIPYDFDEIFKQLQEGIFNPEILPLK